MRERVSEILTFFLIFSFCLFSYILLRIWDKATQMILADVKVLTNNPIVESFVKNSLLLWEKPALDSSDSIKELDPYLKKLDMRVKKGKVELVVEVRTPVICVRMRNGANEYLLVSKDGYILEMNEKNVFEKFPVLYGLDKKYRDGLRIRGYGIERFLERFSKLDSKTVDLISGLDYEKMLVYMRKGIIMKVNSWSNFFDSVEVINDVVRTLPKGTMLQLLSGGRLLLLSRER